jgi:hypothetical protein
VVAAETPPVLDVSQVPPADAPVVDPVESQVDVAEPIEKPTKKPS